MKNIIEIKKRWKPIIWFAGILFVFFIIDLLTKYFLFDYNNLYDKTGKIEYENFLFGIRSLKHANSTFFSSLNWDAPLWSRLLINFILAVLITTPIFFTKHTGQNIALAIILAGILGNTVDVIFTKGNFVKDIIFIPWFDRGTFNFADTWMVVGAVSFGMITIYKEFISKKTK